MQVMGDAHALVIIPIDNPLQKWFEQIQLDENCKATIIIMTNIQKPKLRDAIQGVLKSPPCIWLLTALRIWISYFLSFLSKSLKGLLFKTSKIRKRFI